SSSFYYSTNYAPKKCHSGLDPESSSFLSFQLLSCHSREGGNPLISLPPEKLKSSRINQTFHGFHENPRGGVVGVVPNQHSRPRHLIQFLQEIFCLAVLPGMAGMGGKKQVLQKSLPL
ncbi:MAG: hypothetical protein AABZ13_11515, partial [Planctomycetota bacterium]